MFFIGKKVEEIGKKVHKFNGQNPRGSSHKTTNTNNTATHFQSYSHSLHDGTF